MACVRGGSIGTDEGKSQQSEVVAGRPLFGFGFKS